MSRNAYTSDAETSDNNSIVDAEVRVCNEATASAEKSDEGGRILRVAEVLYINDTTFPSRTAFDDVAVVLQSTTPQTLADMCRVKSKWQASRRFRQSHGEVVAKARPDK